MWSRWQHERISRLRKARTSDNTISDRDADLVVLFTSVHYHFEFWVIGRFKLCLDRSTFRTLGIWIYAVYLHRTQTVKMKNKPLRHKEYNTFRVSAKRPTLFGNIRFVSRKKMLQPLGGQQLTDKLMFWIILECSRGRDPFFRASSWVKNINIW